MNQTARGSGPLNSKAFSDAVQNSDGSRSGRQPFDLALYPILERDRRPEAVW